MIDVVTSARPFAVGDDLPEHVQGPISRATLALFAGASSDYVPLHIDSDFAKAAGVEDVFAHGMLSMAYLAQALTRWAPPERLLCWKVRFKAVTSLHALVHCRGKVIEHFEHERGRAARLQIGTWTESGLHTLDGEAVILLTN
jgi:acyl dehydratase